MADGFTKLSIPGRIAYFGTLTLILVSALPFETSHAWTRGVFAAAIAVLGTLRCVDGLAYSRFRIAEAGLLLPLVGVVFLSGFQSMPGVAGKPLTLDPYETWTFMMTFSAVIVCAEILLNYTVANPNLRILSGVLLAVAIGSAVYGVGLELVSDGQPVTPTDSSHLQQSYAQFLNRNHFALLVEMGLGLLLGILLKAPLSPVKQLIGWIVAAFLAYSVIAAGSRGGVVSFAGLAIFAVFVHVMTASRSGAKRRHSKSGGGGRKKNLQKVVLATGLAVLVFASVIALIALIADDQLIRRIERIDNEVGSANPASENRAAIWASTIDLIKERPIAGSGFGAYAAAITKFDSSNGRFVLEQAHNEYLEILANGGIIAGLLFVAFGVAVTKRLIENMRSRDNVGRAFCFGSAVGVFGVMIHNSVDFGLHVLVNSFVFVVLIVIGTSKTRGESSAPIPHDGWRKHIVAATYLIVVAALAVGGSLHAFSNYLVARAIQETSVAEAQKAESIAPWNPRSFEAAGIVSMGSGDFAGAVESFEKAVAERPNDYRLWIQLGDARSSAGLTDLAEAAYVRSADLAPQYGTPLMHLGLMYLKLGRIDKAFQTLGTAAALDPLYYPEVISQAEVAFAGDANAIEKAISPRSRNGKMIFALHLIRTSRMTESTRAFLLSGELTADEKQKLIDLLKEGKNYVLAHEVWLSTLSPGIASPVNQPILDGGFEQITGSDPSGFGWQIEDLAFISVVRDSTDAHSGQSALKIRFTGNSEIQRPIASQIGFLEAGKQYRLTYFAKAGELVSGGLPTVVVADVKTGQVLGASKPITNTNGSWEERSVAFKTSDSVVLISLQRPACVDRPCPIFGELSIDDFSISADR